MQCCARSIKTTLHRILLVSKFLLDLKSCLNQIVSRDQKITRQSNLYNQLLTKRHKCKRSLHRHANSPDSYGKLPLWKL